MTPKEQKIKEAYGEYWEVLKETIDENGYSHNKHKGCTTVLKPNLSVEFIVYKDKIRPKSLQGIENNNGWTAILSEEDLPKTRGNEDVFIIDLIGEEITIGSTKLLKDKDIRKYWLKTVKYYQPIIKPKPPIY